MSKFNSTVPISRRRISALLPVPGATSIDSWSPSVDFAGDQNITKMIEITCNDRLGKKVRVKCNPSDTIGDLKKLIAAQTGTHYDKIVLKKWYVIYKDHITLEDYEIKDGMNLELYYQ